MAIYLPGSLTGIRNLLGAGKDLIGLGRGIEGVLDPNKVNRDTLKDMIARNPKLADYYKQMILTDEESFKDMFGGKGVDMFKSKTTGQVGGFTPGYVEEQKQIKTATTTGEQSVKLNAQQIEDNQYKLGKIQERRKMIDDLTRTDPDLAKRFQEQELFSKTRDEIELEMGRVEEARDIAEHRKKALKIIDGAGLRDAKTGNLLNYDKLYEKATSGDTAGDALGALFQVPEAEGFKIYYQQRQQKELQEAYDRRQAARDAAAFNRQDARLSAHEKEADAKLARTNEKQYSDNTKVIAAAVRTISTGRKGKPLSPESAQDFISTINNMADRNEKITGEPQERAVWVTNETKSIFGAAKPGLQFIDPLTNKVSGKTRVLPDGSVEDVTKPASAFNEGFVTQAVAALKKGKAPNGKPFSIADIDKIAELSDADKAEIKRRAGSKP